MQHITGKQVIKDAATGLYFAGLDPNATKCAVANAVTEAEQFADDHAATYAAALLNREYPQFAWVPSFEVARNLV